MFNHFRNIIKWINSWIVLYHGIQRVEILYITHLYTACKSWSLAACIPILIKFHDYIINYLFSYEISKGSLQFWIFAKFWLIAWFRSIIIHYHSIMYDDNMKSFLENGHMDVYPVGARLKNVTYCWHLS